MCPKCRNLRVTIRGQGVDSEIGSTLPLLPFIVEHDSFLSPVMSGARPGCQEADDLQSPDLNSPICLMEKTVCQ